MYLSFTPTLHSEYCFYTQKEEIKKYKGSNQHLYAYKMIPNTTHMSQDDCGSCRACSGMLDPSATNGNTTAVFTVIGTFAPTTVVCVDKITSQITQNTNNTT